MTKDDLARILIGLAVVPMTLLMACSSDPASPPDPKIVAFAERCFGPNPVGDDAKRFVGLSEAQVRKESEANGLTVRILGRDGECFTHTADGQPNRVNVLLVADRVVSARRF